VFIEQGANVTRVIKALEKRCRETEDVLEQAWKMGSKIERRPYHEFIEELKLTGISRARVHGVGWYANGRLVFQPDYRESLIKEVAPGQFALLEIRDVTPTRH
jgi:hypothetical protein